MSRFLAELKRRNVFRMAGLYLVGAWLIVQVAETLLPIFNTPDWVLQALVVLLALGLVPALVFSWIYELTPEGLKRDEGASASTAGGAQTARRMDRVLIVVMALALAFFALDRFVLSGVSVPDRAAEPIADAAVDAVPTADAGTAPVSVDPKSIAVLAFANMSADPDNEYFSDGVAEEILNALAKIDGLKVAGRTSSFYFKGRNESLATIGSTLGVAHVLDGSVRKQGTRLRISAQLLRVSDGVQMWTETFDGTDADVFALQERIARRVTSELRVALNAGQGDVLVAAGTADPEAYALYLRATDVFNRRSIERYGAGIADAQRAIELDPGYVRAHSRLATLYYLSAVTAVAAEIEGLMDIAGRHARQALALDPTLAEPHAVLAVIAQSRRDFGTARKAFEEALRLDPGDPTANLWDALSRCYMGYITQCEQRLDRTLAIDPLLPNALGWRARLYASAGELAAAERMVERAREVGLRWTGVAMTWIALARGDMARVRAETADINAVFGANLPPEAVEAFARARVGDPGAIEQSRRIIDAHLAGGPVRINALVPLTLVQMGEFDRGLAVFADHLSSNDPLFLGEVLGTRLLSQAWASPVFPEFLRKAGIAAYWDEFGPPEHCRKDEAGDYGCE
jgi:TolB-like protein